jgi:hypothetical protein
VTERGESGRGVAAPRTTAALAAIFALGVLAQTTFAGAVLGGHETWHSWHDNLGNVLLLPPLASLLVGLVALLRQPETTFMLASRIALVVLVVLVIVTGHSGGNLLAVHVPAAVATVAIVVRHVFASIEGPVPARGRAMVGFAGPKRGAVQ